MWLTVGQTAQRLHLPHTGVYQLIDAGGLPAYRYGGEIIRIRGEDVVNYQRQN